MKLSLKKVILFLSILLVGVSSSADLKKNGLEQNVAAFYIKDVPSYEFYNKSYLLDPHKTEVRIRSSNEIAIVVDGELFQKFQTENSLGSDFTKIRYNAVYDHLKEVVRKARVKNELLMSWKFDSDFSYSTSDHHAEVFFKNLIQPISNRIQFQQGRVDDLTERNKTFQKK